jgi:prophage regulatory protein
MEEILRIGDVVRSTKLSKSTIFRLVTLGEFPQPIILSERTKGWLASDIDKWIKERQKK